MWVPGTKPGSPAIAASAVSATGPFPQPELFGFQLTELHLIFYQYFPKYVGGVSFEFLFQVEPPNQRNGKAPEQSQPSRAGGLNRFGHSKGIQE